MAFRSSTDYVDHRLGFESNRTWLLATSVRGGAHPLSNEPFHVWVDGGGHSWQRGTSLASISSSSSDFRVDRSGAGTHCVAPKRASFLLGQIAAKQSMPSGRSPDTSVRDFDCRRRRPFWGEVRLLCLRCLVGVRSKRGDIGPARATRSSVPAPVMTLRRKSARQGWQGC